VQWKVVVVPRESESFFYPRSFGLAVKSLVVVIRWGFLEPVSGAACMVAIEAGELC